MTTGLIGVDIGGSGIKAGVVDPRRGVLIGDRIRVETPQPAVPDAVVSFIGTERGLESRARHDGGGPAGNVVH